jgi:hypothetical protein
MRFSLAALTAGLTVPAMALSSGANSTHAHGPDADLIGLCDQLVAAETSNFF